MTCFHEFSEYDFSSTKYYVIFVLIFSNAQNCKNVVEKIRRFSFGWAGKLLKIWSSKFKSPLRKVKIFLSFSVNFQILYKKLHILFYKSDINKNKTRYQKMWLKSKIPSFMQRIWKWKEKRDKIFSTFRSWDSNSRFSVI